MKFDWLFKSNKKIASEIIAEYKVNEDQFLTKFANDKEWRQDILDSLYTYVGVSPIWTKDSLDSYVKNGYESNGAVYSIINLISREVKKIKWKLYVINTEDTLNTKSVKKVDVDDPTHDILKILNFRANPLQSGAEFLEELISWKLLTGNSYCYQAGPGEDVNMNAEDVTLDDLEPPQELWVLPAHLTRINSYGSQQPISYYDVLYKQAIKLPTARVIHTKSFNPDYSSAGSHLYGMSPLRAGRKPLTNSNDTYEAASKLLKNLGALGILYKDGDSDFSQENAQTLQRQWEAKTGPSQIRKLMFAGAKMGWLKMSESAVDMSLYQGQRQSTRELCNLYGVSTILLNDPENSATFANYKEARQALWTNAVLPNLTAVRDDLNYQMIPLFSKRDGMTYYLDFDLSDVTELKPDLEKNAKIAQTSWWMNINEKRELTNQDELDDELGEMILIPSNLIPLNEASMMFTPTAEQMNRDFTDDNVVEDEDKDVQSSMNRVNGKKPIVNGSN